MIQKTLEGKIFSALTDEAQLQINLEISQTNEERVTHYIHYVTQLADSESGGVILDNRRATNKKFALSQIEDYLKSGVSPNALFTEKDSLGFIEISDTDQLDILLFKRGLEIQSTAHDFVLNVDKKRYLIVGLSSARYSDTPPTINLLLGSNAPFDAIDDLINNLISESQ